MGLPLKLCAVVATVMCTVALGGNASQPSDTGSPANLGKWWLRTAKAKQALSGRNNSGRQADYSGDYNDSVETRKSSEWGESFTDHDGGRCPESTTSLYGYDFSQHRTHHFHLMYRQQEMHRSVVGKTGELLEQAYRKFVSDYEDAGFSLSRVQDRLTWVVFDDENQYRDYARLSDGMTSSALESYYAAGSNRVVLMATPTTSRWNRRSKYYGHAEPGNALGLPVSGMDEPAASPDISGSGGMLDVRRAVHEAAHQLAFNTGLQKRGVMYPLWISEGLATNFECDLLEDLEVAGDNAPRQRQLARAWSNGRLMPLKSFVTLVYIRSGNGYSANDLYAQSWAFFNFLFKTQRSALRDYLTELGAVEPGQRSRGVMLDEFERAFGSLDRLERSWNRHVESLARH